MGNTETIFLLAKDPESKCHDLIFQRDGTLRIKVICLNDEQLIASPNELQFFGNNKGQRLVFETVDYNREEPVLIIDAIRWYANYIGNPQMEIEAELQ